MANDLIFNPLLKKGFQYSDDGGDVEAEIEDLRQHKITKCLQEDDINLIAANEIFQWQGNNITLQNTSFVNGYFYKKILLTETLIAPVTRLRVFTDTTTNFIYNGIPYDVGDYWCKTANYNNLSKEYLFIYPSTSDNGYCCTVVESNQDWFTPGTIFKRIANNICENVILQNAINYGLGRIEVFFTDGTSFLFNGFAGATLNIYFTSYNQTGFIFNFATDSQNQDVGYICAIIDNQNNIIDWVPLHCFKSTYNQNVTIKEERFSQTNTQPPTPGITEENGTLKVSLPVQFEDDVTVKGTQTVVHTEKIESENDYIELRADNPLGLASGEMSGIEVNNYDDNGTDCVLAVDATGWARVGDKNGTLQKLATIEENPTDAQFVQYDATAKELKTAAIPEASTTAAGLMSAADKILINSLQITELQVTTNWFNNFSGTVRVWKYGKILQIYLIISATTDAGINSRILDLNIQPSLSTNYVGGILRATDHVPLHIFTSMQNGNLTFYLAEKYNMSVTFNGSLLLIQ